MPILKPQHRNGRPPAEIEQPGPASSLLVRLWNEGHERYGEALRVYCENYAVYDWGAAGIDWQVEATANDFNAYGDVLGWRPLRERLAARDAELRGLPLLSAEHVAVTAGATQAIHAVLTSLRGSVSRVLIPAPGFIGYQGACAALGLPWKSYLLGPDGQLDLDCLEAELVEPCVVIVNTPHNPTGAVPTTEQIKSLLALIHRCGGVLLVDAVYDAFVYEGIPPQWSRLLGNSAALKLVIFVNSFSKTYGVPGLRLGWATAHPERIAALEPVIEYTVVCVPAFNQRLGLRMLGADVGLIACELRRRRDLLCRRISAIPGVQVRPPSAGTTVLIRLTDRPAVDLVEGMLRDQGIFVLPGTAYHGGDPATVRLSFGYPEGAILDFTAAIERQLATAPGRAPASVETSCAPMEGPGAFYDGLTNALAGIRKYVASQVTYHLFQTGLFDAIEHDERTPEQLVACLGMDYWRLQGLLDYCQVEGIVARSERGYSLTPSARALGPFRAWFQFFIGGYGDAFRRLGASLRTGSQPPPRDFREVGAGSCEISRFGALPLTERLLAELPSPSLVVDCGCGTGLYLAALCERNPSLKGIGLEPHPESVGAADEFLRRQGLTHRVSLVQADVASYFQRSASEPAPDAIIFAFVLHELVGPEGDDEVLRLLRTIRKTYPQTHLLVVETMLVGWNDSRLRTGIGRGYYNPYFLTQRMTDQRLQPLEVWLSLFSRAGYRLRTSRPISAEVDPGQLEVGFLLDPNRGGLGI
jgi:2-ketoarginine methyltransferase